jgi:hypothetical protein
VKEINDAAANDANETVPKENIEHLQAFGAFGMLVPEEYEGAGLGNIGYARMSQIIGMHDLGLGIFVGAHQSIGYKVSSNSTFVFSCLYSSFQSIDYRCDNRRFWLSAHNCRVPTPTSQNLELEQQIWIFGAD